MDLSELYDKAQVYEEKEDYLKSIKYYTLFAIDNPKAMDCYLKIAQNIKKIGLSNSYIENYLKDNFDIPSDDFIKLMSSIYRDLCQWQDALKFASLNSDIESIKTMISCYYHLKDYSSCINAIIDNYTMLDKTHFGLIALCCALLINDIPEPYPVELYNKLKDNKMFDLLDAYNFLALGSKYYGNSNVVQDFCNMLIASSNVKCIKYIRRSLENVANINHAELALKAFDSKLYYLSEEILSLYCQESKHDYNLLVLQAKIQLELGNIAECQKYVSYARIINDSKDLYKLACLCKIIECIDVFKSYSGPEKLISIEQALEYIEDAKKFLL